LTYVIEALSRRDLLVAFPTGVSDSEIGILRLLACRALVLDLLEGSVVHCDHLGPETVARLLAGGQSEFDVENLLAAILDCLNPRDFFLEGLIADLQVKVDLF
jgi:hypothetical protein